jgi:hypothetical protein
MARRLCRDAAPKIRWLCGAVIQRPPRMPRSRWTPKAREFYENYNELSFNTPLPWSQGPRSTDKNADVLWVGNSWGASLARIDTRTGQK